MYGGFVDGAIPPCIKRNGFGKCALRLDHVWPCGVWGCSSASALAGQVSERESASFNAVRSLICGGAVPPLAVICGTLPAPGGKEKGVRRVLIRTVLGNVRRRALWAGPSRTLEFPPHPLGCSVMCFGLHVGRHAGQRRTDWMPRHLGRRYDHSKQSALFFALSSLRSVEGWGVLPSAVIRGVGPGVDARPVRSME